MPFQPAPNCAEAVIRCDYGGREVANVLNFWNSGGYTLSDIQNLADAVDGVVPASYLPYLSPSLTYLSTDVRGLASAADLTATSITGTGVGGGAGTPLPANVTLAIKLLTGVTGRSNRGRFFALPSVDGYLDGPNHFLISYADAIVGLIGDFQVAAQAVGWELVVLSRFTGGAPRVSATHRLVTTITYTDTKCDSQRGRLK